MLRLRVKAPFASFRHFTAGSYRPTAPFITPSAAYGLVLNLAGIESRLDDGRSAMTLMRTGLPAVDIALGAVVLPEVQTMYQQLHNYPVGETRKEHKPNCKAGKYNIQPIRREFLSGIDAYICLRNNSPLEEAVRRALKRSEECAESGLRRYGVPFLGDNNFVVDLVKEEAKPEKPAFWYSKVQRSEKELIRGRCRLTIWIDRTDMTQTVAALYAPTAEPEREPPDEAWTSVTPPGTNNS